MRWWRKGQPALARRRKDETEPGTGSLAEECDAFLAGEYAELLERRGEQVPPWAWVNRLAHGDEAELTRLADARLDPDRARTDCWRTAQRWLAAVIVDVAHTSPGGVRQLQAEALVPLELVLAASEFEPELDRRQVVALVLHAVSRRPGREARSRPRDVIKGDTDT